MEIGDLDPKTLLVTSPRNITL